MTAHADSIYGTYLEIEGRPALRFERQLAHTVDSVWRAVTEPGELAHWFPAEVAGEIRAGGTLRFKFTDGVFPPSKGQVLAFDPPARFEFTWEDQLLRFELEPRDGGATCLLRFTTILSEAEAAARDAAGWTVCLEQLERRLAGKPAEAPTSEITDGLRVLYAKYSERGFPTGAPMPGDD